MRWEKSKWRYHTFLLPAMDRSPTKGDQVSCEYECYTPSRSVGTWWKRQMVDVGEHPPASRLDVGENPPASGCCTGSLRCVSAWQKEQNL